MKIQLKNFSYQIPGEKKSLFSIPHLEIPSGEKLLIRGPSGSGKSSFLHALVGLIPSSQGEVFFAETSLLDLPNAQKTLFRQKNLALIFQRLSLIEEFSLLENVLIENDNTELAEKWIETFGLKNRQNTVVRRLSLGEQQRVAIIRAMMKNYQVLLADEPTSSLDDESSQIVMREILNNSKSKTLICVSHDHRIEKYFDRILQLTQFRPHEEMQK